MHTKREIFARPIPQNPPLDGPVLLKDGRPAYLRRANQNDLPSLEAFLQRVSDQSMALRFLGSAQRGPELARRLIVPPGDFEGVSLVVTVGEDEHEHIVAVGSYTRSPGRPVAEVAFLVEDKHQSRGIGMLLLERLAIAAEEAGLTRLEAVVLPDNQPMLRIFMDSGYEITRQFEGGDIMITFPITPTRTSVEKAEARDRIATVASLIPFFHPKSIAVIGASRRQDHIGHRTLYNLVKQRFPGPVFPVNREATVVSSMPAYASILDIERSIDLAIVAVPAENVLHVVDECAEKGVRGLIVLSAGFAEAGPQGEALQNKLVRKVRGQGMRLIGPNCLGLLNAMEHGRLHATFTDIVPPAGRVAMSSQSGALGLAVLEYAQELGLGFSSFVGIGNKADVSGNDLLQYWEEDASTDVILLYLESFGNPRRFANLARRIGLKKPILAVKGGRTEAGQRAAGSHTAAKASDDDVVAAFFRQTGVVRCDTLEEMFDIAILLSQQPLPRGRRVAVVSNAGGPATLCADACEAHGLHVPALQAKEQKQLQEAIPNAASIQNPLDLSGFATVEQYKQALSILLAADYIDSVIVLFTPIGTADRRAVEQAIHHIADQYEDKTILTSFMGTSSSHIAAAKQRSIPSYRFPESAARALAQAVRYAEWRTQPRGSIVDFTDIQWDEVHRIVNDRQLQSEQGHLTQKAVTQLMKAVNIRCAPTVPVANVEEAIHVAHELGYPVVLKQVNDTFGGTHWTGVHTHLESDNDLQRAYESMKRRWEQHHTDERLRVVVQPMVPQGRDLVVRVKEAPDFGPVVSLSLAGQRADAQRRLMPLTQNDAYHLVRAAARRWLWTQGESDDNVYDLAAMEEMLQRLSRLVQEIPDIVEIELDPLRLYVKGQGCQILKGKIRIAQ